MAISKLILNGEVQMDVTSDTVTAGSMLSGTTATKNDGTKATGTIATKTSSDLTASGATVTAPAGYYANAASKAVATTTHPNPTVSFNSSTRVVTASHAQTAGYVTAGTTTSTITISAGSAFPPAVTITKNPTFSMNSATGVVTASYTGSSSITPTVTSGYVSQGTAGVVSTTGTSTYQLTSKAAATFYPSTADQTIASYRWLTGTQTIKSVTTSNLTAENIAEGVVVRVGDSNNASRIAQITGTHSGGGGGYTIDQIAMKSISGSISGDATYIGSYTFYNILSLTTASFPSCSVIFNAAFSGCRNLTTAYFSSCKTIGLSAFYYCSKLETISFPICSIISSSAFYSCYSLKTINLPVGRSIYSYAFYGCSSLNTMSIGSCSSIYNYAFAYCRTLLSLYLLSSNVATLGSTNAFTSTPISTYTTYTDGVYGSIFVPSSLYNSYLTATNWAVYSARFVSV